MMGFQQYNQEERNLLNRCFVAYLVSGTSSILLGSLLPYLREAHSLSFELSGMMVSAQSLGNFAANILAGILPLFLGRRKSIRLLAFWVAAGYLLLSLSGVPALLIAACVMLGLGRGGIVNFGNVMVGAVGKDAGLMSLFHGVFAMGAFLAPFLLLLFTRTGKGGSWRYAAWVMVALGLLQFVLLTTLRLPRGVPEKPERTRNSWDFLKSPRYWCAGFILMLYTSSEYGITGWLVSWLRDSGVVDIGVAQMMSSLLWLVILIGRFSLAGVGGRFRPERLLVLCGAGYLVFFLILFTGRSVPVVILGTAGTGLFMSALYPVTLGCIGKEIAGIDTAMSILVAMGGLGGTIMPTIIGFVSERVGINGGMSLLILAVCATLLLLIFNAWLHRPGREAVRLGSSADGGAG